MAKVITHEEVNALISGVFPSDPKMAVLYGDLSTDERFVINPNNAVTNLPYKANQALLDADIRVRGSLTVTLEPESATVLSTATTMVFNITTGGTGTITNWTVSSATIGGADRKAYTSFNSSHTKVTMTIPANTSYSPKVGAVQISVTTGDGTFPSNTAQSTQNPASRLVFQNATSSQSSTATTTTQAFTNNNCTNVAVQSKSTGVNATISGSNVVITFHQNTGDTSVTRTVTISGKTADNVTTSTTHTITQQAAVGTGMVFEYNGNDLGSGSGSIPASDFTLTLTNARLTSSAQTGGLTIVTGGTATAPTIRVSSYPANPSDSGKEYTITLKATDIYGRELTKSVTINQEADTYTFTITPNPNTVGAFDTTAVFTVTTSNINNVGISAYDSDITGRTYSNNTLTTNFSTNSGTSSRSMEISLTGTTAAGRTITRSAEISQSGGGAANLNIVYNGGATRVSQVGLDTNDFTITASNVTVTGYSATNGADILSSGATSVNVRIPANQTDNEMSYKVIVSGTNQYDQTTVTAETTVYQSSDEYTLKLVPSATSVEFTSTGYTFGIVSSNVTGIVISSHEGTTSETISGNQLVLGYSINDSATSRNITVSLSGTTAAGRPASCSAVITQAGASGLNLSIDYPSGTLLSASGGTTSDFVVTKGGNVTILGYSVDVQGASVSTGTTVTDITLTYPNNQTESEVTYTITVIGSTPTGNVSDSCTVNQVADTYVFNLAPQSRTIQPDSTAAFFNLTATSINNIGYYAPDSLNVTGIINLTDDSVSATGITPNMTGQQKTIRLVLSGNTVGGRTVYATGVTAQEYTKSKFEFENNITENWDAQSVIISFNYDYLMQNSGEVSLTSEGGAYFDSLLASTATTVSIIRESPGQTGHVAVYFAKNQSTSQRVYTINATGNVGQAGETTSLNDSITITHDVPGQANLTLSQVGSEHAPYTGGTLSLSGTSSNVDVNTIGMHSGTSNIPTYGSISLSGTDYSFTANIPNNTGNSRNIEVIVSATTYTSEVITASTILVQDAAPSYNPDIWWTKTSEGPKSTEVTSVNDVPAFVPGTYDGRNVVYTIYINYNSDVTGVSLSESWLISGVSATRNGKTVSISVPANEHTIQMRVGAVTVTGTAQDGSTASSTLTVVQVGGVEPYIHIEGVTTYTKNYGDSYDSDDVEYALTRSYVNDSTMDFYETSHGNFNGASTAIDTQNDKLIVCVGINSSTGQTVSSLLVTGTTVYGTTTSASFAAIQNGTQPQQNKIWIKSGHGNVEMTNESSLITDFDSFTVTIDSVTALDASAQALAANSTQSVPGTLVQYTGNTSYCISADWDGSQGADWTTTIKWKENDVQKEVNFTGCSASTQVFVVTGNTELSDFKAIFNQRAPYNFTSPQYPTISIVNRSNQAVQVNGVQVYCKYYGRDASANVIQCQTGVTVAANSSATLTGANPTDAYDIESVFVDWSISNPNAVAILNVMDLSFSATGQTGMRAVSRSYYNVGVSQGQVSLTILGESDLLSKVRFDMEATADVVAANGEFLLNIMDLEMGDINGKYYPLTWTEPTVVNNEHKTVQPDSHEIYEYSARNASLTPEVEGVSVSFLQNYGGNSYSAPTSVTFELSYLDGTTLSIPLTHNTLDWYKWDYEGNDIPLGTVQMGETKLIPTNIKLKVNF